MEGQEPEYNFQSADILSRTKSAEHPEYFQQPAKKPSKFQTAVAKLKTFLKKHKTLLLIIAAIIILAVAGFLVWHFFLKPVPAPEPEPEKPWETQLDEISLQAYAKLAELDAAAAEDATSCTIVNDTVAAVYDPIIGSTTDSARKLDLQIAKARFIIRNGNIKTGIEMLEVLNPEDYSADQNYQIYLALYYGYGQLGDKAKEAEYDKKMCLLYNDEDFCANWGTTE